MTRRPRWHIATTWPVAAALGGCAPEIPELPSTSTPGLVLLVHGARQDPSVWADDLTVVIEDALEEKGVSTRWTVVGLDWARDADVVLTAARRGRRIGRGLAPQVDGVDALHVIAHSVGAHLGDALLSTVEGPTTQLTLLDPFVGSGLLRWGYGRERFGDAAFFAEAYVNTDDGVPSSDGVLEAAHNFDVTAQRPAAEDGHDWPIAFYADSLGSGVGLDLALSLGGEEDWTRWKPGEVTTL